MKILQKIINKILHPSIIFCIIFFLLFACVLAGIILVLAFEITSFWVYILYAVSFIFLCYFIYLMVILSPKIKNYFINQLKKNKYAKKYLEDYSFKTLVSATLSYIFNTLYGVFLLVMAIISRSFWYGALSVFYIALSLIRGNIVLKKKNSRKIEDADQLKLHDAMLYRNTGIYIILVSMALAGAIAQMVISNQSYTYAGLMIYAMAAYTFYRLVFSIIQIFRSKNDMISQAIRNIGFAYSLVSIFALQTAMFQAFSPEMNARLPNAIVGAVIVLYTLVIGIVMTVVGQKHKKIEQCKNAQS